MKEFAYVVTAYRWGNQNDHSYLVGVYSTPEKAIEVADSHTIYRGGKYACWVEKAIVDLYDEEQSDSLMGTEPDTIYMTKSSR